MKTTRPVLVALSLEDLPIPYVPSHKKKCANCGCDVWVDADSPSRVKIVCIKCVSEAVK